ncbi:hypothetical protein [Methylocystis heyeri]|uniref:Uncharacterized protein n=1 Tax=Methylocystis heyeri TaxID=391905 RepID=A0A6B8KFF5_9HYPH|nr:hypothetical protein [Methylocystis heyeri]QGM47046.1 hypothetical protein H2LOC_015865 [Methylocystis heyeri]
MSCSHQTLGVWPLVIPASLILAPRIFTYCRRRLPELSKLANEKRLQAQQLFARRPRLRLRREASPEPALTRLS